ncbi:single-stranded DNA-binding protein [Syntrophotalea acetylenivorans]|uniref:single-stranded DNA-binding protein n=1 Tax=Syntrophotalea acetylenivorans TaxID=1842532 RepID=UPI0009F8A3F0
MAEICSQDLIKGSQVYIEGKLQTRSYDDRNGNKRHITEVIASQMQVLSQPKKFKGFASEEISPEEIAIFGYPPSENGEVPLDVPPF